MFKFELLAGLDDGGKAAVLAGGDDFARFKIYWRTAVTTFNVLGYCRHFYAFRFSRLSISLPTMVPDMDA